MFYFWGLWSVYCYKLQDQDGLVVTDRPLGQSLTERSLSKQTDRSVGDRGRILLGFRKEKKVGRVAGGTPRIRGDFPG